MILTDEEKRMLDGSCGEGMRRAMEIIVTLAKTYDAERLIKISSAHLGATFKSHGIEGLEWVEELVEQGARCDLDQVLVTLNPRSFDNDHWREIGFDEQAVASQERLDRCYRRLGTIPVYSCVHYLLGNLPKRNDHFSWSGSSGQVLANSVLGAMGNREGVWANVAAAVTGRTPEYGLHLKENRAGQVLVTMEDLDLSTFSAVDYARLGYFVGREINDQIPVFSGLPKYLTMEQLRGLAYSLPVGGAVPMFHVLGVTPEARTYEEAFGDKEPNRNLVVGPRDLRTVDDLLNTTRRGEVDLICFGCPHCTVTELREAASLLEGKRVSENVRLWLCTSRWMKDLATRLGYREVIERAGGYILSDICAGPSAPFNYLKKGISVVATNSVKTAFYAPGTSKVDVLFGDTKKCIEAAIRGKWEN
jgi:predicted aconitase